MNQNLRWVVEESFEWQARHKIVCSWYERSRDRTDYRNEYQGRDRQVQKKLDTSGCDFKTRRLTNRSRYLFLHGMAVTIKEGIGVDAGTGSVE